MTGAEFDRYLAVHEQARAWQPKHDTGCAISLPIIADLAGTHYRGRAVMFDNEVLRWFIIVHDEDEWGEHGDVLEVCLFIFDDDSHGTCIGRVENDAEAERWLVDPANVPVRL